MSFHRDLLDQGKHLAKKESRRPKQASLRRAVSSAYYSLFHLLIYEGGRMLVSDDDLRILVQRCFNHGEMKEASKAIIQRNPPDAIKSFCPAPSDLVRFAEIFIELQEKRHQADYNLASFFTRNQVLDLIAQTEEAFNLWQSVRHTLIARVYLASLLFSKKWNR